MLATSKQIAMYDKAGNDWNAWASSANYLLASARVLRAARDAADLAATKPGDPLPDGEKVGACEFMLKGFALECLFKGLWVKRGNVLARDGKLQRIRGAADHDLLQLSQKLAVRFSSVERDVLKRLSVFMTSVGRYPIPSHWSKNKLQKLFDGGKGSLTYWVCSRDDDAFASMVAHLETELET